MNRAAEPLLQATDTTRRRLQHGAILAGVVLFAAAGVLVDRPDALGSAAVAIAGGIALFAVAGAIKQRWEVTHKGHRIRFVNNPLLGERLYIDEEPVARGKLGYRSEMRGWITSGDGIGDQIVAVSEAGLLSFRCRIVVEPAADPAGRVAANVSDAQLLAEVHRRGLHVDQQ